MRRVHAIVSGMVQGVGYRFSLQAEARDAAVTGWVRNRRDGTVEAELQGGAEQVARVLDWMAMGPPAARVEAVSVTDAEPIDETGFRLRETV